MIHIDVTRFGTSPTVADTASSAVAKENTTAGHRPRPNRRHLDASRQHRYRVPAHRHRRPLPRRLRRNLRRQESASLLSGSCQPTAAATRSHAWRDTYAELEIKHQRTRPYRRQANGSIERFHRTPPTALPTPASTKQTPPATTPCHSAISGTPGSGSTPA